MAYLPEVPAAGIEHHQRCARFRPLDGIHPLGLSGSRQRVLVFMAVLLACLVAGVAGTGGGDQVWRTGVVGSLVVGAGLFLPWGRLPGWVQIVLPLGMVLAIGIATVDVSSGFAPLLLVPVVWTALHGTVREVGTVCLAATAARIVDVYAAPSDAGDDLRRAFVWGAVALFTGITVERLVGRGRDCSRLSALGRALEREAAWHLRRFELLVRYSTDVISILSPTGTWLYSSPAGTRQLGYPEGHAPDGGIFSLVHPDDLAVAVQALQEVVEGTRSETDPVVFRVRDVAGGWRHFESCGINAIDDPVVQGVVIVSRDVTERQRLLDELAQAALRDPLTGLYNRGALEAMLDAALARARRAATVVSVLYIDLDHFKPVNDRFGHRVGDEVLCAVGARLEDAVRRDDVVGRLGGDEFVVVCETSDPARAGRIAARVADALQAPYSTKAGPVECRASVGMASARTGESGVQVVMRADAALYRAKERGRSQLVVAS